MKILPLTIAGVLLSTTAFAQPAPPPPSAPRGVEAPPAPPPGPQGAETPLPPPLDADAPPPPPRGPGRGPRGDRPPPPPPPPGAFIHVDRGADGSLKLDVHCVEAGSTKDCADITTQLLDKLNSPVKAK